MAVDEVLLDAVAAAKAPPTLRFYQWSPACLSLGYFQSFEVVDVAGCRALGVDIVRRPTGGRAILHDRELTYSLALPSGLLGDESGVLPSYQRISAGLQRGLADLGVMTTVAPVSAAPTAAEHGPICFDRPSAHEILLRGRKLVGSAQVRRAGALLQHGSIVIESRMRTMMACLQLGSADADRSAVEEAVIGLNDVGVFPIAALAGAIGNAIAQEFDLELRPGGLDQSERAAASVLMRTKYQSRDWTERMAAISPENSTRTR
jgi:lipoate-protein ligase A